MAYKKQRGLPLCKECGERHVNTKVCEPRRLKREAAAAAAAAEEARLERNRNTLPELETVPGRDGFRPYGDRLYSLANNGGVLSQVRPARPSAVHVPDSWRED